MRKRAESKIIICIDVRRTSNYVTCVDPWEGKIEVDLFIRSAAHHETFKAKRNDEPTGLRND